MTIRPANVFGRRFNDFLGWLHGLRISTSAADK
jgi:hypothetical protein